MLNRVDSHNIQSPLAAGNDRIASLSTTRNDQDTSSSGTSASITANDFLTLLVTEMKNQDPTANTDPNEYINQLVQVNSLQQLIAINETLTTALGESTTTTNTAPRNQLNAPLSAVENTASLSSPIPLSNIDGNLSLPAGVRGALPIASSLSSRY